MKMNYMSKKYLMYIRSLILKDICQNRMRELNYTIS